MRHCLIEQSWRDVRAEGLARDRLRGRARSRASPPSSSGATVGASSWATPGWIPVLCPAVGRPSRRWSSGARTSFGSSSPALAVCSVPVSGLPATPLMTDGPPAGGHLGGIGLDIVAVDLAPPALAVPALALDVLLEALQVTVDPSLQEAERVTGGLDRAFRLRVDAQGHLGLIRPDRVGHHRPGILRTLGALPGDPFVRCLIGDLGLPLLLFARDLRGPLERPVVEPLDALHALHEPGKVLELGPLVVRDTHGSGNPDRLFEPRHRDPPELRQPSPAPPGWRHQPLAVGDPIAARAFGGLVASANQSTGDGPQSVASAESRRPIRRRRSVDQIRARARPPVCA